MTWQPHEHYRFVAQRLVLRRNTANPKTRRPHQRFGVTESRPNRHPSVQQRPYSFKGLLRQICGSMKSLRSLENTIFRSVSGVCGLGMRGRKLVSKLEGSATQTFSGGFACGSGPFRPSLALLGDGRKGGTQAACGRAPRGRSQLKLPQIWRRNHNVIHRHAVLTLRSS